MAKASQIIEVLERRIKHGDYLIKELPTERELAYEFGVSNLTARRVYQKLIEKKLLAKKPNGRPIIRTDSPLKQMQIAFLAPAFSQHIDRWRLAIQFATEKFNSFLRPFYFLHWDDPIIVNDLANFDGAFVLPIVEEPIPQKVLEQFCKRMPPVVSLDVDLSPYGIPTLEMMPPVFVQSLLDYLFSIGHRSIHCLSVYYRSTVIQSRINQWQIWKAARGIDGELIDVILTGPKASSFQGAYETVKNLLKKPLTCTALLCTTTPCAMGAMRACIEEGIMVGKDLSICSIDGEGYAPYLHPSLTCLDNADPFPYVAVCLEWMQRGGENWIGPLKMAPTTPTLFYGESTGSVR